VIVDVEAFTDEVMAAMLKMQRTLDARNMGYRYTNLLRERFQQQIEEAFVNEGPEGYRWPGLSEMRIRDREGSADPVLQWTGRFGTETTGYRGVVRLVKDGFSFWFPDTREVSPIFWGLTKGQLVNPLGLTPLAAKPRPLLGNRERQYRDSLAALLEFFRAEGWEAWAE
jgi:hypothetical protein